MPGATRQWEHVLEAISGYLWLGRLLSTGDPIYRSAWNFATMGEQPVTVGELSTLLLRRWSEQLSWLADAEGCLNGGGEAGKLRPESRQAGGVHRGGGLGADRFTGEPARQGDIRPLPPSRARAGKGLPRTV